MHKSRLAGFIIDCETDDLERAADFWSAALGLPVKPLATGSSPNYRTLAGPADQVHVEVQKVEHPSRVHLDIEADDVEADASSGEARRQAHRFCAQLVRHGSADGATLLRREGAARGFCRTRQRLVRLEAGTS